MEAALKFVFRDDDDMEELESAYCLRPRIFRERRHYFEEYDERDFSVRFRLSKESAVELLKMVEHNLEFSSNRNQSIAPIDQLLMTLRYYATGSYQQVMADYIGASTSTANRIVHRVSCALAELAPQFIQFPETNDGVKQNALEFYEMARFPKAVGALDCTHIRIQSPGGDHAECFRNRKGYMSLNVQVICNAKMEILDIVARWPGSAQDQTILNASHINFKFENGKFNDAILLADCGYMNRPYIMMPLDNPVTPAERLYNESQIRSRNAIERLFGIWKRRFPVLALGMHCKLKNCFPIIIATAVVHNILRNSQDPYPPDDPDLQLPAPWDELIRRGIIREQRNEGAQRREINPTRRAMINNYFRALIQSNEDI